MFRHRAVQQFLQVGGRSRESHSIVELIPAEDMVYRFRTDKRGGVTTTDGLVTVVYEVVIASTSPKDRPYVFLSEHEEEDSGAASLDNPDRTCLYRAHIADSTLTEEDIRQTVAWLIALDQLYRYPDQPIRYIGWNFEGSSEDVYDGSVIPLPFTVR